MTQDHPDITIARAYAYLAKEQNTTSKRQDGVWNVRRFAQEDWILNVMVFRIFRRRQRTEVALFRSKNHQKFVRDSGTMGGLVFLLADAYHQTGSMAIDFLGPMSKEAPTLETGFEPAVPEDIKRVARTLDVKIANERRIDNQEGKTLFARLTGLSNEAIQLLRDKGIDEIRACFLIQRGTWKKWQVEYFAQYAYAPEGILQGTLIPENWLPFARDLFTLRSAIIAERIVKMIENSFDEEREVRVNDVSDCVFQLKVGEAYNITAMSGDMIHGEANNPVTVAIWPSIELDKFEDLLILTSKYSTPESKKVIALPYDISHIGNDDKRKLKELSDRHKCVISIVVDSILEIDRVAVSRMAEAVTSRNAPPERPD